MAVTVTINFNGERDRIIKFTPFAARRFKEAYGLPLWKVRYTQPGEMLPEMTDTVCTVHVIWAGLLATEPKTTLAEVEKLLEVYFDRGSDLKDLNEKIYEAFDASGLFGRVREDGAADPNA